MHLLWTHMRLWWFVGLNGFFLFLVFSVHCQTVKSIPAAAVKNKEQIKPLLSSGHEKKKAILAVVQKQQEDWNKKNMSGFLEAYWKSDTLRSVTNRGVVYGWDKISSNHKKNNPDTASMGHLDYDVIHVELISETDALVTGKFLFKINKKFRGGYFTFLFRKLKGKWVVVAEQFS